MTPHSSAMTLAMPAPTYPKELIGDAALLAHRAQEEQARRPRPEKTGPNERAYARAAIFTAVNALESFIIDLAQERIKAAGFCACCAHRINENLLQQKANLAKIIGEWPIVFGHCPNSRRAPGRNPQ